MVSDREESRRAIQPKNDRGQFLPAPSKDDADIPALVERYLKGDTMEEIAKDNRVARRTIYRWMIGGLGDKRWQEVVTECLVARVADADAELEAARESKDPVRVSAARETCRFARMDLERRRPGLYGVKQEVKHTVVPVLNYVLLEKPSTIERDVTPVAVLPREVVDQENQEEGDGDEEIRG